MSRRLDATNSNGETTMFKTTLVISGMMCGMCEAHINDALRRNFDVRKVTSSHKNGITEMITLSQPDVQALRDVISKTGYELGGITTEPYKKKGLFGR